MTYYQRGIAYGDVIEGVNFEYAKKLTAVNAITLAQLAWAPPAVQSLGIGGAVQPSAKFRWKKTSGKDVAGYKIYWRETTSPIWQFSRFVGDVDTHTLEGIVIDNFFFGISTVGTNGFESEVVFPNDVFKN